MKKLKNQVAYIYPTCGTQYIYIFRFHSVNVFEFVREVMRDLLLLV